MSLVAQFVALCQAHGSDFTYHRDDSLTPCPCRSPQGFRDPIWHVQHPGAPFCNAAGMLTDPDTTVEFTAKGFIQPVQSGAVRRLTTEEIVRLFGETQEDDHIGIMPITWNGTRLEFLDWGNSTEDWIEYNGRKFTVVNVNLIPDPSDGNPEHHWEVGLRLFGEA